MDMIAKSNKNNDLDAVKPAGKAAPTSGKGNAAYQRYAGVTPVQRALQAAPVVQKKDDNQPDIEAIPEIEGKMLPGSVLLPQEVATQFYAHGGFMGAAPDMLADPIWNRILKVLMPDVYAEVYSALRALDGKKGSAPGAVKGFGSIIPMFENNPVMSAYGMWATRQLDQKESEQKGAATSKRIDAIEAFEWDAFLPTELVKQYNKALPADKPDLAADVVNEMIIAHGTKAQTVFENTVKHQYKSVDKTAKTNYGGNKPKDWMDLFGRALRLAGAGDQFGALSTEMATEDRVRSDSKSDDMTFEDRMPVSEVITIYKQLFGADRTFSVIIDIKSRDASVDILKAVTRELNTWGVHVAGFGSFKFAEIEGVSEQKQSVDGEQLAGPKEVKFLHLVGSVLTGVQDGTIRDGDHMMFNAGSLLVYDADDTEAPYKVDWAVVDELRTLKLAHQLNIGLYVQEPDIDPKAVAALTEMANSNRITFNMGFAWGGLANRASAEIETRDGNAKQGFGGQDSWFVAEHWKQNTTAVQKSILSLWARHGGVSLQAAIEEGTELKFPKAVSNAELVASWPTVIEDYSLLRDVKCSSLTLSWGQEKDGKADVSIAMTLGMLGGGPWSVNASVIIPLQDLGTGAKK